MSKSDVKQNWDDLMTTKLEVFRFEGSRIGKTKRRKR